MALESASSREFIFDWEILLSAEINFSSKTDEKIHAQFTKVYLDDTEKWTSDICDRVVELQVTESPSTGSDRSESFLFNDITEDNSKSSEEELDQDTMDRIAMGLPASFGVAPKKEYTPKQFTPNSSKRKGSKRPREHSSKELNFDAYWGKHGKFLSEGVEELSKLEPGADLAETAFANAIKNNSDLLKQHRNIELYRIFAPHNSMSEDAAVKPEDIKEFMRRDVLQASLILSRNRAETFAKKLHQFSFVNGFHIGSKNDGAFERPKTAKEVLTPFENVKYNLHDPVFYGKIKRKNYSLNNIDVDDLDAPMEAIQISPVEETCDPKNFDFSFDPVRDARLVAKNAMKIFGPNMSLLKYWHQRYRLFSKLNDGILMDEEGWFSVTPETIAIHIADRMVTHKDCVILDAFTGVGGNAIQFALRGALVYAIDMDPIKLRCARQNARVYGVEDRITFICGNFYHIAKSLCQSRPNGGPLCFDSIFLSPPWGGPEYLNLQVFELSSCVPDGFDIFDVAVKISQNIAYFLPRNTSANQLMQIAGKTDSKKVEVEHNVLNNKIKALTAYYGNLVSTS